METREMSLEAKRLCKLALAPVLLLMSVIAMAAGGEASSINMSPGVTAVGREVYDLHMTILVICAVIGFVVFAVMFYSIIYHRKSRGVTPATFHESTKVEIAWTVVPFIILIVMAIPATTTLLQIYNNDDAELDVVVTGYQWKWKYEYLNKNGENVSFFSNLRTPQTEIHNTAAKGENYLLEVDEPLVLPVDTKVRFLVTGNDVIHSWWVPSLAVKRDAIPGFVNEVWTKAEQEGVFRGQCAELCGKGHGFMPIVVSVVSKDKFAEWMGSKQADAAETKKLMAQHFTLDEQMERGKAVYTKNCLACHGANGEGGVGKPIAHSAVATGDVSHHMDIVLHGVPGTAMQAFGAQLNDVDLSSVITYERNAFGNNMGETVQPIDVFNHKKG
jgi:cytochrome c oxidase subunit 2